MARIIWKRESKGLEYYSHATRKHGIKFDRYFRGRYTLDGKTVTIPFGWESEWTAAERSRMQHAGENGSRRSFAEYCSGELFRLKENARRGTGPATIKAERELAEIQQQAEEQTKLAEEKQAVTFGEYFETVYFPISRTSKKKRSYAQELSHFKYWLSPVIGEMRLNDIRPIHIERIKKNLLDAPPITKKKTPVKTTKKQSRSPRMIQYVLATGRQCWNYAKRDGLVKEEWPGKSVKIPKIENRRMRFLSDEDGDKLLADLKDRSQQLHDICLLSFDTGMRADEIFSLKRNRVDLTRKTIKVFDGKGRDRIVFMTDRVSEMLHRLPRDGEMVFLNREGKQIKEISNSFDRAVKALGLNDGVKDRRDKLVFHSLRHSFASRLVERGVDLYIVAQLMGHASIAMTERYSHLRPDTLKAAVKSLEETTTQPAVEEKVVGLKG
jgi:integrase